MIHDLASVGDCDRFLRGLGYATVMTPVGRESWPDGLEAPSGRWWYGGSFGSLDVHVLEAREPADGEGTLRSLVSWNTVRSHALIRIGSEGARILLGRYGRRTASLRLDRPVRSEEVSRRLAILRRDERDPRDPAELFGRALESDSTGRMFFRRFRGAVEGLGAALRKTTRVARADCEDQALLVMCRLLFLRFVERKGWLDDDPHFLRNRLDETCARGASVWIDLLEPLFFGCLNQPAETRTGPARGLGRVPYLNGGLFERSAFERRHSLSGMSNDPLIVAFRDVFELFDFSVAEDTEDVTSVDPEMLGRVFESLMEAGERSSSGSFYTPPALVDALVVRALAERLGETSAERDAIHAVLTGAPCRLTAARRLEIAGAARELKILDPACGTGAFLLSALHMLEKLLRQLGADDSSDLRRSIVESQLFGIDRKREAVRLCELRLWLAVVATERRAGKDVPPLPNLDRNVTQGDALLSPIDFGREIGTAAERAVEMAPLPDLPSYRRASGADRARYRRALQRNESRRALALIDAATASIRALPEQQSLSRDGGPRQDARLRALARIRGRVERGELPFFDWRVHFPECAERGGFDLVVGNPPWVRHSRIDPAMRAQLARRYEWFAGSSRGFRQADLYVAFLQRSFELLRDRGTVSMLVPAKLLTATYASVARREILSRHRLVALVRGSGESFDADTFPLMVLARKLPPEPLGEVDIEGSSVPWYLVSRGGEEGPWLIAPDRVLLGFRQMERNCAPLASREELRPRMGVKTGDNAIFVRGDVEPVEGGSWRIGGVVLPAGAVVRLMRGRDLRDGVWQEGAWMLWPEGLVHLDRPSLQRLGKHVGASVERLLRLDHNPPTSPATVAWKDVALRLEPRVLPSFCEAGDRRVRVVPNQTLYFVPARSARDGAAIEAILGSTPAVAFALATADVAKDHHRRYMGSTVGSIPFPFEALRESPARELSRLKVAARRGNRDAARRIDLMAAGMYGLSPDDVRAMRMWIAGELQK